MSGSSATDFIKLDEDPRFITSSLKGNLRTENGISFTQGGREGSGIPTYSIFNLVTWST